ncbi:MAG: esterase-like activity of phytase family protein [Cyanobacteria bacterium P01_H01_bin.121]
MLIPRWFGPKQQGDPEVMVDWRNRYLQAVLKAAVVGFLYLLVTSCAVLLSPSMAQGRLFKNLSVEFLGSTELPADQRFEDTVVGGLSGIIYDRQQDQFYVLSDARGYESPPRFYTLQLDFDASDFQPQTTVDSELDALVTAVSNAIEPLSSPQLAIQAEITAVTTLQDERGQPYPANQLDPEAIALSPQGTLYISSEGVRLSNAPPRLLEFDLSSGQWLQDVPVPQQFKMAFDAASHRQDQGIQDNRGFEGLAIPPFGTVPAQGEPIRLFTMNESPLMQDFDPDVVEDGGRLRWLHYYIGDGEPLLIAEHVYTLDPVPLALINGVTDLLALDQAGHFLTLERAFTPFGHQAKLFQATLAGATDVTTFPSLKGELKGITKARKQELFNLKDAGLSAENFEGMTLGPRLPDGSQSLIVVSDNNFESDQATAVLVFRLQGL